MNAYWSRIGGSLPRQAWDYTQALAAADMAGLGQSPAVAVAAPAASVPSRSASARGDFLRVAGAGAVTGLVASSLGARPAVVALLGGLAGYLAGRRS